MRAGELEAGRDRAELAQGTRLELPDTFAGDAEADADLFERHGRLAGEAERCSSVRACAGRASPALHGARSTAAGRGLRVRLLGLRVLDHVPVEAFRRRRPASRGADGFLDQLEQFLDALDGEAALRDLVEGGIAVELLREHAARARDAAHLLGHVHGQPDRAALLGQSACDRLPDPPGRVRRELVAHRVVELLDRANGPEVPLLDEIEGRTGAFV